MQQMSNMVLDINKKGWTHNDIQPGNVRWDPNTGKPTAIDWGWAQKRPATPWYKGGKLMDKYQNRKLNAPVEDLRQYRFQQNLHVAVDKAHRAATQPVQPVQSVQTAQSCGGP
jgi:hypothetical protein